MIVELFDDDCEVGVVGIGDWLVMNLGVVDGCVVVEELFNDWFCVEFLMY